MTSFYDHYPGDLTCPMCDKAPEHCDNCGGVIHFEVYERASAFYGLTVMEEAECDVCGPDYVI